LQKKTVKPSARPLLLLGLFGLLAALLSLASTGASVRAQNGDETPLPLYALPDAHREFAYTSSTMALANDARTLVAVNMLSDTVTFLVPTQRSVITELPVGKDPRSIAMTLDGNRALTANRGDDTLSVLDMNTQTVLNTIPLGGSAPYGVVTNSNQVAYVTLENSDEVVIVDINEGRVTKRIPVADSPAGMVLWGDFLYVTHFWTGQVTLIYLPEGRIASVISTGQDSSVSQSIALDITRGLAYLPQTRSNAQNVNLTYDTTVFPVVNVLNLRDLSLDRQGRITLDTADRPVNMPFAAAVDRFRNWLYVVNAGTNDLTVIDLVTGLARAHIEVGANPRGVLLNKDNTLLFVHNALDATITVIETSKLQITDVLPISNLTIPNDVLIGAQMFHSADDARLSADGWLSCATCHFDGQSDRRVWMGFPDGPRDTPLLYELPETAPYLASGTWDELADVDFMIRDIQGGHGLIEGQPLPALADPNTGLSPDLDTLVTYLLSIQAPQPRPSTHTELVARGAQVFTLQGCAECHVGDVGTNLQGYDVGTGLSPLERRGQVFDTPSLRWLWLSAPYFHNGSAPTLYDVFALPGVHRLIYDVPPEDIDALVEYLLSLPQPTVP
jgi:YVTN family beta-propeller protein